MTIWRLSRLTVVTPAVLRRAPCPVMTVQATPQKVRTQAPVLAWD
ncbi:MAG: hypothetical protein ACYCW6_01095 [Candidatus Xenobia bacterium]